VYPNKLNLTKLEIRMKKNNKKEKKRKEKLILT